jgi:hypothetical protein
VNFQQWFAAHRRRNPNARINARTRDLYRAWLRNNPQDPGSGGPGGGGRVPGLTPETAQPAPVAPTSPTPPTPPPPPAAARRDSTMEQNILNIVRDRNLLPAQYNQQRNRAATNFRSGMLDGGFFDFINMDSQETKTDKDGKPLASYMSFVERDNPSNPQAQRVMSLQETGRPEGQPEFEGNITYRFTYGPDGRIYRQAYMNNANTFAARGVSGSLVSDAQRRSRRSIDTARDQSIRNYNETVETIAGNQGTDTINTGNTEYKRYTSGQDVTVPSSAAGAAPADASGRNNVETPADTSPAPASRGLGSWTVAAAGRNAIPRLTNAVRTRNPGVSFRIVRRGNRYVAVRT